MQKTANEVLVYLGISKAEILSRVMIGHSGRAAVYLSGSHVSGYATKWSDLDVFVLGDAELIFSDDAVKQANKSVMNVYVLGQRVDYEQYSLTFVQELVKRLSTIDWSANICGTFSRSELDFMYRFAIGSPVVNETFFNEVLATLPKEDFRRYLFREALGEIEDSMEDLGGLTEADDRESSILVSCHLVEATMDALCHHLGNINPSKKWRMRVAKDFVTCSEYAADYQTYLSLRFPERNALFSRENEWKLYAESCANFSETVLARVQSESGWR